MEFPSPMLGDFKVPTGRDFGGGTVPTSRDQTYFFPLSLAKGEGDTEPALSLPKEGEGF